MLNVTCRNVKLVYSRRCQCAESCLTGLKLLSELAHLSGFNLTVYPNVACSHWSLATSCLLPLEQISDFSARCSDCRCELPCLGIFAPVLIELNVIKCSVNLLCVLLPGVLRDHSWFDVEQAFQNLLVFVVDSPELVAPYLWLCDHYVTGWWKQATTSIESKLCFWFPLNGYKLPTYIEDLSQVT